jgi:hypothetical protein
MRYPALGLLLVSVSVSPLVACGNSSSTPDAGDSGVKRNDASTDARTKDGSALHDGSARDGEALHDTGTRQDSARAADAADEGGARVDAGRDSGLPACTTESWSTYGHDGQRTFASGGCVAPTVAVKWHYTPTAPTGRTFEAVFRALGTSDGAFLAWMASDAPYTGTTAVDRVSTDGARVWTWDSHTDTNFGNWPTLADTYLAVNDDGLNLLAPDAGTVQHSAGVDWWGQTIADPSRLYVVNQMQADGPGLFVGAVDTTTHVLWQGQLHQACGKSWSDVMGGIALDNGVLFYAPQYQFDPDAGVSLVSGVYAFDATAGTLKWTMPTTPASAISAGNALIYLVENATQLVARKETDGTVAWSVSLTGDSAFLQVGAQAPVLANGLAIVATSTGIAAFNALNGSLKWTSPVIAPAYLAQSEITNGCGTLMGNGARETTLAAALASNTLVVTAPGAIDFLSLSDGHSLGSVQFDAGFSGAHDPVVVGTQLYVVDATSLVLLE